MQQLGSLEALATDQSRVMWQALAEVDAQGGFSRLRGEEQLGRGAVYEQLEALKALEAKGEQVNAWLGLESTTEAVETLDYSVSDFLANVQSIFGFMSIMPPERLRDRFRFGDPKFDYLQSAINDVSTSANLAATRAGRAANLSTLFAVLITLLAAALAIAQAGRLRANRVRDLEIERTKTLRASEARFRALVQHSSDLITVLEPDYNVRYASPASGLMLGIEADDLTGKHFYRTLSLAEDIDQPEATITHTNGETKVLELQTSNLLDNDDVKGIVVNARDISERKALEERLRYQALHDPLTDLPNRRKLQTVLTDKLDKQEAAEVLFVDLDGFKLVNDSFGHRAGDHVLKEAASRIASCLGEGDLLGRQGGDEFIVITSANGLALAERIVELLKVPFNLEQEEAFVSASVGVVSAKDAQTADELIQQADIAMYHAKRAGKARAMIFTPEMAATAPDRLKLETDFRRGLERGEFTVYYQPKVSLETGRTESLEALVRWNHPEKGLVSPTVFIPFAEETGLIEPLGKIILDTACKDAASWQSSGVIMAVNLSPVQFRNPDLIEEVREALATSGLDPKYLELEITESAVLGDVEATIEMLNSLKALGVRLAIDDFGTGYSNLSHLKHYDVDVIKIDQSFVRGGHPSSEDLSDGAIVEAVIAMAKALDLHVVAEGVETQTHAQQLHELGCDLGQGYFFSKPVPSKLIKERLEQESK